MKTAGDVLANQYTCRPGKGHDKQSETKIRGVMERSKLISHTPAQASHVAD